MTADILFAAIFVGLLSEKSLPLEYTFRRAVGYYPSVALGIESEHRCKQVFYLRLCKTGNIKLLTEQGFGTSHLTCKGRAERSGSHCGNKRFRLDIHLRKLRI